MKMRKNNQQEIMSGPVNIDTIDLKTKKRKVYEKIITTCNRIDNEISLIINYIKMLELST